MFRKYPSLYLLILVVAGIVLADQLHLPAWLFLLGCLVLTLFGVALLGRSKTRIAIYLFGGAMLSFAGYNFGIKLYDLAPNHIANFVSEKETYQIFGTVADWPVLKSNRTEIKIKIDSLGREQRTSVKGAIMLRLSDTTTALQRGDRVEFRGHIYPLKSRNSPGSFDYARYLQLKGIFGIVYLPGLLDVRVDKSRRFGIIGLVDNIRHKITTSFNRNLTPNSAALASGILIGETRNIPVDLYERFRDSGTLHLLAVSGSNVALVLIFLIIILRPFSIGRKKRAVILMISVFLFALLSYGEPSVVRASVMAVLVLLATIIERRYDLNQIIATAALIILLVDPTELYSVGFQLSFVTAWGLIFATPKIIKPFQSITHKVWFMWLVLPLLISCIAQIFSAPLIAFYFGRVPAISVIANLFIIPLVSIAVVGVLALLAADLILPILGQFFGSLLDTFMQSIFYFLKAFGEDQSIVINTGDMSVISVVLLYAFFIFAVLTFLSKNIRRVAIAMIVVILNISLAFSIVSAASSSAKTRHLDILQIPGGIAGIVNWTGDGPYDLVVTGLESRSYPIDERIFEPILNDLRIPEINRIFVLEAEYNAIDDIIRISSAFNTKRIFVEEALLNSFNDQLNFLSDSERLLQILPFKPVPASSSEPGIYPGAGSLGIKFERAEVRFLNSFEDSELLAQKTRVPFIFVFDGILGADQVNESIRGNQNVKWLVCSKLEQRQSELAHNGLDGRIYNLDSLGACRLSIPEQAKQPLVLSRLK